MYSLYRSTNVLSCKYNLWHPLNMFPSNEPELPSTSSSHAAPDHDATTTMLDCRRGSIFLVVLTRASPHMLDTILVKQVYLRLIRPQDMVPVIHALGQVVFSKLFAGFFVSQLQKRLPSGTTDMQTDLLQCVAYGLSRVKRYTCMTVYHDINRYDNHTGYICLSTVFGENKRCRISSAPRQQLST